MVLITFDSLFLLLDVIDDRLYPHETPSTSVLWSSSTFWPFLGYQLNSWWEVPSLPSMIFVIIDHFIAFRSTQLVRVLCCILISLLSSICSSSWSITIFYVKNVMRIAPPLKISWYSDTSHHHHSFLVPMLILTGMPTSERCCLDSVLLSNPIALELMVDSSSLDYWITNHHSNIDHAI